MVCIKKQDYINNWNTASISSDLGSTSWNYMVFHTNDVTDTYLIIDGNGGYKTSSDGGNSWSSINQIHNSSYYTQGLITNKNQNLVIEISYAIIDSQVYVFVYKSSDLENWTRTAQITYSPSADIGLPINIVCEDNRFIIFTSNGYKSISTDLINWTSWSLTSLNTSVYKSNFIFDGTKIIYAGSNGNIYTSTDSGTSWTTNSTSLGSRSWKCLSYNDSQYLLLSTDGYISVSIDGLNWTTPSQNSNLGNRNWVALAYGKDKFVIVGKSSSSNYISNTYVLESKYKLTIKKNNVVKKYVLTTKKNNVIRRYA